MAAWTSAGADSQGIIPLTLEEGSAIVTTTNNPGRERILERIRAGLRAPVALAAETPADKMIFEPVVNPRERFQQEAKANLIDCLTTTDAAGSAQQLAQVLDSLPQGDIFVQDAPVLRRLIEMSGSKRPVRWSSQSGPAEASQATITLVEALIAQTGSILVSAACGGRGASVVAPCHIAFATLDQLVPDLETALSNASRQGILENNSFACVISGSSRTADIEKILVQGAHGPRRLVVIVEAASC
jgi:L-lactate dehydrogenase complex protein LldG